MPGNICKELMHNNTTTREWAHVEIRVSEDRLPESLSAFQHRPDDKKKKRDQGVGRPLPLVLIYFAKSVSFSENLDC